MMDGQDSPRETRWERVVAATEGHYLDKLDLRFTDDGRTWTFAYCSCGNLPDLDAFTEAWEFTDHIRRLVFASLSDGSDG